MKTASIFHTRQFDNALEYVAAHKETDSSLDWDSVTEKGWAKLAEILEIDIIALANGKARRAIDKASEMLTASIAMKKPVSTKLPAPTVTAEEVEKVNAEPAKEKKVAKVKEVAEVSPVIEKTIEERAETAKQEIAAEEKRKALLNKAKENLNVAEKSNSEKSAAERLVELLNEIAPGAKSSPVDREEVKAIVSESVEGITEMLSDTLSSAISMISEHVDVKLSQMIKTVEVKINESEPVKVGFTHFKFEDILLTSTARLHSYLVGPAGSGKTHTCEQVAAALNLTFGCISVCAQSSKTDLLGYQSVTTGDYISTEFRKAYEFGGVFVLDEIDNGNPNIISVLNSALSNGVCAFPDGMINKHEDFVLIACANTYGTGADRMYVGRNQLDAATLDRFVIIDFPYDEKLELAIAPNEKFTKFVQSVRAELKNERVVISPRASIKGGKLLNAGMNIETVIDMVIKAGLSQEMKNRVDLQSKK